MGSFFFSLCWNFDFVFDINSNELIVLFINFCEKPILFYFAIQTNCPRRRFISICWEHFFPHNSFGMREKLLTLYPLKTSAYQRVNNGIKHSLSGTLIDVNNLRILLLVCVQFTDQEQSMQQSPHRMWLKCNLKWILLEEKCVFGFWMLLFCRLKSLFGPFLSKCFQFICAFESKDTNCGNLLPENNTVCSCRSASDPVEVDANFTNERKCTINRLKC